MAWNPALPSNTEKIRQLGIVIRPNWVAIEDAEADFRPHATNFIDRTAAALPIPPPLIAQTLIAYCAQSGALQKMFTHDSSGNILQLLGCTFTDHGGGDYTLFTNIDLILKFGRGTASLGGDMNTYPVKFPVATNGVVVTPTTATSFPTSVLGFNDTDFTAYVNVAPSVAINYIAWGA